MLEGRILVQLWPAVYMCRLPVSTKTFFKLHHLLSAGRGNRLYNFGYAEVVWWLRYSTCDDSSYCSSSCPALESLWQAFLLDYATMARLRIHICSTSLPVDSIGYNRTCGTRTMIDSANYKRGQMDKYASEEAEDVATV